jgi:hypothetical protein
MLLLSCYNKTGYFWLMLKAQPTIWALAIWTQIPLVLFEHMQ